MDPNHHLHFNHSTHPNAFDALYQDHQLFASPALQYMPQPEVQLQLPHQHQHQHQQAPQQGQQHPHPHPHPHAHTQPHAQQPNQHHPLSTPHLQSYPPQLQSLSQPFHQSQPFSFSPSPTLPQYPFDQGQQYQSQFQPAPASYLAPSAGVVQQLASQPQPQVVIPSQTYPLMPSAHHPQDPHQQFHVAPQSSYQPAPPLYPHGGPQTGHHPAPDHFPRPSPLLHETSVSQPTISVVIPSQRKPVVKHEQPTLPKPSQLTPKPTPSQQPRTAQAEVVKIPPKQNADTAASESSLEPDYPSLLCVLADDYLDAARKLPDVNENYFTLVAMAIGCLEAVLVNFQLSPLREAQVSLHYAQLLYEETENHDEAETRLTKSIELCERHKFVALKYEMQLLLAKFLFESRPKTALRDIQRMIDDLEAYRHVGWLYIFRFQLAMFSLAATPPGDVHGAVGQLDKITGLARQQSDSVVVAFATTLEALLHLSKSGSDAVTACQTALATARSLQLNPNVSLIPQLSVLIEFIDFSCILRDCNIAQIEQRRKAMHDILYRSIAHANWRDDGCIYIPIGPRSLANLQVQPGGHLIERNGAYLLSFAWLTKDEVEALGFLLSADSSAYKNGADSGKAEKYADNGLSLVRSLDTAKYATSVHQSQRLSLFRRLLEAQFLLLLCFMQCSKGSWSLADTTLSQAETIADGAGDDFPVNLKSCVQYLKASIFQGTGNVSAALQLYQSPTLSLGWENGPTQAEHTTPPRISNSYHPDSDVTHNFRILASMNAAFIIQNDRHPQHNRLPSLITQLDAAVQNSGNKYIAVHYSLLVALLSTKTLSLKQYLRSAMEAGKAIGSAQTTALALIYMQARLFHGTVDEQAMKCARAASHQVRRWGNPMWTHVAAGLEADCLEINGMLGEASQRQNDADATWEKLPENVKGTVSC